MKKKFADFVARIVAYAQFGDTYTKVYILNKQCKNSMNHDSHTWVSLMCYTSDRIYFCKGRA